MYGYNDLLLQYEIRMIMIPIAWKEGREGDCQALPQCLYINKFYSLKAKDGREQQGPVGVVKTFLIPVFL